MVQGRHTEGKTNGDVALSGPSLCRPPRKAEALGRFPEYIALLLGEKPSEPIGRVGVELQLEDSRPCELALHWE